MKIGEIATVKVSNTISAQGELIKKWYVDSEKVTYGRVRSFGIESIGVLIDKAQGTES